MKCESVVHIHREAGEPYCSILKDSMLSLNASNFGKHNKLQDHLMHTNYHKSVKTNSQ